MPDGILEISGEPVMATPQTNGQGPMALFTDADTQRFQTSWSNIQGSFVDEPRVAVERADELVDSMIQRLTEGFAAERQKLEGGWSRGSEVSTEDLRQALRRYRSFFDRLLRV